MRYSFFRGRSREHIYPWLVLGILLLYTYVNFFQIPYVGFEINPSNGIIHDVFGEINTEVDLHVGDRIIKIEDLFWTELYDNRDIRLFGGTQAGQEILIIVERGDSQLTIPWVMPGVNISEIIDRTINIWILGYIFWLVGTATLLAVRPKDSRWKLFIAFNYLTAIWLVIGNVSQWHVWGSSILLHAVIWLCVPVYLHFHWVFPKSLGKVPKLLLGGVYLVGSGLAAAELFQILPGTAFYLGFLIAVMGSAGLLIAHFIVQPMYRKEVRGIVLAGGLAILPSVAIGITGILGAFSRNSGGALLALPLLPIAYYYAIYRRQLGGLEARSNQLIASYLFFILLGTVLIIFVPLANTWFQSPDAPIVIGILVALTVGVLTATGYPHFTSWIEKRVLSMPMSLTHMAETYSERISTNLKKSRLIQLLKQELLPSLLIRQSALLRLEDGIRLKQIYTDNVNDHQLPTETNIHLLETEEGNYYASTSQVEKDETLSWIKLAIPLKVGNELIGLWLLGSRDPDDYYAPTEIPGLQSVANQTAIALVNIEQAERIHALYQADIERTEEQRANIARDLHDIVLNELASLSMKIDDQIVPGFQRQYQTMVTRTREMISGLRPAMLSYGLPAALEELVDETSARVGSNPIVQIDISPSDNRYDLMVETHLYRIIQQAVDNALQHAQASAIQIYGSCELDRICLTVKDDGIGFMNPDQLSFDNLLKEKHFGLAGMYERAEIIGAELAFDSAPDRGTRVRINWNSDVLGQKV